MILSHPTTKSLVQQAVDGSSHAILLYGPDGSGKLHMASYFASQKLGLENLDALQQYPYFRIISPEKNSITIDQIRGLQKFLQLKTPGDQAVRRVIIIENSHAMTLEAQNALLKALEEPPADTVIVLTAPKTLKLNGTIYSRVQQIPVLPVSKQAALEYFGKEHQSSEVERAFLISNGGAGLMYALLQNQEHDLLNQIDLAKTVFGAALYDRLLRVDDLSKQKELIGSFLYACKLICLVALKQDRNKSDPKLLKQWNKRLKIVHKSEADLDYNPNTKLLLSNLFLQI